MNKLFTKIAALFLGMTMAVGVGVAVSGNNAKTAYANGPYDDAATMTAGTNGSSCKVNNKSGIKVGTSSKGGDMSITVPAGATALNLYAAAWKGVKGLSLNITPNANVNPKSISLTADDGISNSTPFTLSGQESNFNFEIELSNITEETTLTFASSTAKRFVVWKATYSTGGDTPTTYTVKFYDGSTEYTDLEATVNEGSKVTKPANPTKSGYSFVNWYTESTLENVFDFDTEINQDYNLYAKWEQDTPTPAGDSYVKISSTNELVSGEKYLIVYEDGGLAFDGSLSSFDAVGNSKAVSITSETISATGVDYYFTIAKIENTENYSLCGASGKYAYQDSDSNGLSTSDSAQPVSISFDSSGNVTIVGGGAYFRYNSTSGQTRFRFYKSSTYTSQKAVQLYKFESNSPSISATADVTSLGIAGEATVTVTKLNGAEGTFSFSKSNNNVSIGLPSIEGDVATYTVTGAHDGSCDVDFTLINTEQDINTVRITFTVHKSLVSIALSGNYPKQLEQGSPFSHEGMVVTATYDDGPTADVTESATFSAVDMQQLGNQTVTVSYTENNVTKTADYTLTIVTPTHFTVTFNSNGGSAVASITNIESGTAITKPADPTKTNYRFDVWCTDDELTTEYNFSTPVTSNFTLYARWILDTTHAGTEADPYSVADARFAIDVNDGKTGVYATGIVSEIVTAFNPTFGNISYNISTDGTTTSDQLQAFRGKSYDGDPFTSADDIQVGDVVVVKGDLKKYGTTYEFDADNQLVSLSRKTVTKIELSGTYTTSFVEGSEFNHDGVVVTATYDDASTKDVSSLATFSTPDMTQLGEQTITVTFGGQETTYKITITERQVDSIAVATMPTKTSYYVDDTMNIAGLTITVTYETGEPATIDSGFTLTPAADYKFTSADLAAGSKTFTVTYKTKTTTFDVNVVTKPTTIDDTLTRATTGIGDGANYGNWSGKSVTSDAVYAGNSGGDHDSIQLRSNNSNSGIVTTASGGKIKKVTVVWEGNTQSGRTLNVYGKSSAYTAATDLYSSSSSVQGAALGTIVCGTSTELTITGDYEYVGVRSNSSAMYLTSITFVWDDGSTPPVPPTPTEQTIISGTFDYNDKASLYVEDKGTMVVSTPEGMETLFVSAEIETDFVIDYDSIDIQTNTTSFKFTVGNTDRSDVELTFLWYDSEWNDLELTATVQLINPAGLDEARYFAEFINEACGSGSEMSGKWEALESLWTEDMDSDAKDFLLNAHYDVTGTGDDTVVTKHDDTHYELADAMSRYDFMVEHYGMTNFMNKAGLSTGGRVVINPFVSMGENSIMVAIVVIVSVVSLTAIGGYFFLKKRREQN